MKMSMGLDFRVVCLCAIGILAFAALGVEIHSEERPLLWSDEFDGVGAPDPKKWNYETGFVRNGEAQFYASNRLENARQENGYLILEARKERFNGADYTSASLTTLGKFSFKYGRAEIRAKVPAGRGTWPAFWMKGANWPEVGWPVCGETDVMEFVGYEPDAVNSCVHYAGDGDSEKPVHRTIPGKLRGKSPSDGFHVYAVEWTPKKMDFYFDEELVVSCDLDKVKAKSGNPFHKPQYLLLNLAIGGNWGGKNGIDESIFPCRYVIDYVRVWGERRERKRIPTLGYMLDVSRCKVPTMPTLYRMVDVLSSLGYNELQLYTEHTFRYAKHETVWRDASPMTPDEVRALDDYCAKKGISLVANQNSFGHLENWLVHPGYNDLAECPTGGAHYAPWHYVSGRPMGLCPTDPRSIEFLSGLYDELLPCFRSPLVNVGCDETLELLDDGEKRVGRSAALLRERGPHRVYLDFLGKINDLLAAHGKRMMFWGDIVLQRPDLIPYLPKNVVCLDWGYELDHPFERETAVLEDAGLDFYVCPGTSTWNTLVGRFTNMTKNIDLAVLAGERHGAKGLLLTDWGDTGHPHPWVVSLPAIVYASMRVRGETPDRTRIADEVDRVTGARCGWSLIRMGDAYLKSGGSPRNVSELDTLLRGGAHYTRPSGVTDATLAAAMGEWRAAEAGLELDGAPDWVRDGFAMVALLREAVETRIADPATRNFRARFETRYRALWLKHYRPGGLERSLNRVFGM